jgi:uncharacterized protein YlxW (UPF0749 family)
MPPESHDRPGRRRVWRVATPVIVLLSGVLFAVSAEQSDGLDLRGGRLTDLASVVRAERDEAGDLTAEAASLNAEVEALSTRLGDRSVSRVQEEIATLVDPAGLTEKSGPAVQVTLDDASVEARTSYEGEPNDLVVHQQDIQAVANALWKGGAEAMTIQGQRVITTTGIKCEGNAVMLQGVAYAQPYVISAIGNPAALEAAVLQDDYLAGYRAAAAVPDISVGWDMRAEERIEAPAYEGVTTLQYAEPLE